MCSIFFPCHVYDFLRSPFIKVTKHLMHYGGDGEAGEGKPGGLAALLLEF